MLQNAFALLRNSRPGPVTLEAPHRPLPHRRWRRGDGGPPARARPDPTLRVAARSIVPFATDGNARASAIVIGAKTS